jgi:hypothetical protein
MAISILNNTPSLVAQNQLSITQNNLNKTGMAGPPDPAIPHLL